MTTPAGCSMVWPSASRYATPVTWPLSLLRIFVTRLLGRTSRFPLASASAIAETRVLDLASFQQPKPVQ